MACTRVPDSLLTLNRHSSINKFAPSRHCVLQTKMVAVDVELRLQEKNIVLPDAAPPAANYVPYVVTGNYIYVAGQIPLINGELKYKGKVCLICFTEYSLYAMLDILF